VQNEKSAGIFSQLEATLTILKVICRLPAMLAQKEESTKVYGSLEHPSRKESIYYKNNMLELCGFVRSHKTTASPFL